MKPILFTDEMVRAVLDGRKTQTRRPLKPQPEKLIFDEMTASLLLPLSDCPLGQVGDRLWVRETWAMDNNCGHHFRATEPDYKPGAWNPPMYMPHWASRITLEITDVRIQRIAEISNEDCVAEGIPCFPTDGPDYQKVRFFDLWDSLYAKKGFGWEANPWVWAITFKKVE